jgi:signal transduction histidine kinase
MENVQFLKTLLALRWLGLLMAMFLPQGTLPGQRLDDDVKRLAVLPNDSNRVVTLLRISSAMVRDYPDSAMRYASQAMVLSRSLGYLPGEAQARLLQARAFATKGDLSNAEASLEICKSEFGQAGDMRNLAKCALVEAEILLAKKSYNLALAASHRADSMVTMDSARWSGPDHFRGRLFLGIGGLAQANGYFRAALRLASESGDVPGRAEAGEALGDLLLLQGRYDSAAIQYHSAAEAWKAFGNRGGQARALVGQGTAKVRSGKKDIGFQLLRKAYLISLEDRSSYMAGLALIGIAEAEMKLGIPDSAMKRCYTALNLLRLERDPAPALDARIGIIEASVAKSDFGRAYRHGDTAITIAHRIHAFNRLVKINGLLAKASEGLGDYARALQYFRREAIARDSLARQVQLNQALATEVQMTYDTKFVRGRLALRAEEEMKLVSHKLRRTRIWLWGSLVALFLCIGGGLVLLLKSRAQDKRMKQRLLEQADELEQRKEELARVSTHFGESNVDYDAVVAERTETLQYAVESLIAENEALETFIGRSSNDLLDSIARLKGLVMVAKDSGQVKELVQAVDMVEAVAIYTDKILRKIIQINELKNGFREIAPVNLEELILDIRPQLKEIPGVKYPDIRLEDRLMRPVIVDRVLIRVILENLLENACIFRKDPANDSPKVEVLIQMEDDGVMIRVTDEGIGIPHPIREKIFDLFFRGTERSKGQGLGLYLVHRAVREIGGRIAVESKEGFFTEFVVRFREQEA